MTGYGRGEATNGDVTVVVEMKSVNNRYRDVNLRVPREYMVLEPRITKELQDRLQRGRLDVFVRRSAAESGQAVESNPGLAHRYLRAMTDVAVRLSREPSEIPLSTVLSQPGVLTTVEAEADALVEWEIVSAALNAALDDLVQMRAVEGEALRRDLVRHFDEMQRLWAEVQSHADGITERLRQRLTERIVRLIGDQVDPNRLAQEAAILADKADVSEELARLASHFKQFTDAMRSAEPVGRKLDFLLQELNREINTIGSKAAEHPISGRVVEMKSVLERLREQVANVE
jgi:uncharacterized protein (TIGR00255 family)